MKQRIGFLMTLVLVAAFSVARADECVIKAVKPTLLETSAIGYGGHTPRVVIVEVILENTSDQPIRLNWKNAVPVLQTEGKHIEIRVKN